MDSTLSHRFNTNYVPTLDEICILQQELAEPNQKIRQLEDEIKKHQDHIFKLKREKEELERYINVHNALLSPIRHLLPDVLREIFYHCLPTGRNPVMSRKEAPILLGRVCSQWRDIALTTPRLWASIHIPVPSDDTFTRWHTCSHAVRTRAIKTWLSRSGACPLSISFSTPIFYNPGLSSEAATVQLYLDAISPFVTRCKSIYVWAYRTPVWTSLLDKYRESEFPMLDQIHFSGGSCLSDDNVATGMKDCGFFKAPQLRSLSIIVLGSGVLRLPVRWEQLTELNLSEVESVWESLKTLSPSDALTLLSWCPSLKFCSIGISDLALSSNFPTGGVKPKVSLPNLIGFSIQADTDPRPFFTHFSAPALLYFQYHQEPPPSADEQLNGSGRALHLSLGPFIQRVIHPVEEFQLLATYLSITDVIKCLELFPGLKRLSLLGSGCSFDLPSFIPLGGGDVVNRLSIGELILRRLTPGEASSTTGTASAGDISDDEASDYLLGDERRDGGSSECLCPQLEAFNCSGSSFTDSTMLKFLRSRSISYEKFGVARLRWASMWFHIPRDEPQTAETLEQIDNLRKETGLWFSARYSGSLFTFGSNRKYSPYDGSGSVNPDEPGTYIYNPWFGSIAFNEP